MHDLTYGAENWESRDFFGRERRITPAAEKCNPAVLYRPAFSAAWRVFLRSMAIVIGPTPPGTGVIAFAT
jgi:hypothetical protein